MAERLEVRLLGPVEASTDGRIVLFPRMQVRQMLALLAAVPGTVLSTDELVDQLWFSGLPAHPRRALQVVMSRLRSALGSSADLVRGDATGYLLDTDQIDLLWFRSCIARSRSASPPHSVISELETALELWRGAPFSNALGPPLLDQVRRELEESRLLAITLLAEALIAGRDSAGAVAVARSGFEVEPHHERLAMSLARGLSREGRKTEALAVLNRLRTALRTEMGIDPSTTVVALEHEILSGSVDLRIEHPVNIELTPPPFVGRMGVLGTLMLRAEARLSVVAVGEAGMGKTTLLTHLTEHLRDQEEHVISIRIDPEPTRPLAPIADLARQLVSDQEAEPENHLTRAAVGRLIPDLVVPDSSDFVITRDDLTAELARFIVDGIRSRNVVVLVDDLQFVDSMSSAILEQVVAADGSSVIAASRPSPEPHLQELLRGRTAASVVELEPLSLADVSDYVGQRYDRAFPATRTAEVHSQSGGNPLYLTVLVDLDLDGALASDVLPTSVLVAVRERLDGLANRAIETLQVAAALGTRFPLAILREIRPNTDLDIGEAVAMRLISVDESTDQAEFAHGLVADAAYQMMSMGRRIEVHDQLGQILEAKNSSPAEYVAHYTVAASLDPVRAALANLDAGVLFAEGHSLDIAIQHFTAGIEVLRSHHFDNTRLAVELMVGLGRTQRLAADANHLETLVRAGELARLVDELDLFGQAVIELCSHGATTKAGRVDQATLELIDDALALPVSTEVRAELLASATALMAVSRHYERGQKLFGEALDLLDDIDDPGLEARVLVHIHLGMSHPDDFERRADAITRLNAVAGSDVDLRWEVSFLRFWQGVLIADASQVTASIEEIRALTPRARHRHVSLAHIETAYAHLNHDFDKAEELLERAFAMARSIFPESWAMNHYVQMIFAIRSGQGRLAELGQAVDRIVDDLPETPNWRAGAALIAAEAGALGQAADELAALAVDRFAILSTDLSWTATLWALARVASLVDDRSAADVLYSMLAPHQGRMSWAGACTFGPNDRALGLLAQISHDEERAERHFAVAESLLARLADGPYRASPDL